MMPTAEEISRSMTGAWQLFRGQDAGMKAFDVSFAGFWRSFTVIILMAPLYAIAIYGQRAIILSAHDLSPADFPDQAFITFQLINIVVDWVTYPIIVALLAGPLGIADRYVAFIVARNWTSVIALVPYIVPSLLFSLGLVSVPIATILTLVAIGVVLRYRYVTTRAALGAPMPVTAGLVVLDLVLGMILGQLVGKVAGFA